MTVFLPHPMPATRSLYTRIFAWRSLKLRRFRLLTILPGWLLILSAPLSAQPVSEADLRTHIEMLAGDSYGGRRPGTDGEAKTLAYIAEQWAKAGLVGGAVPASSSAAVGQKKPASSSAAVGQKKPTSSSAAIGQQESNWFAPVLLYGNSYDLGGQRPEVDYPPFWSFNVVGKLPGIKPEAGAVLFMAHWDHFGRCDVGLSADRICNGAIDNASGIALLIEVAKRLKRAGPFDRDIYFLATTGEEIGLLGARAFADRPPRPLGEFVAVFNIDSVALSNQTERVAVVGRTNSIFERHLRSVIAASGRNFSTETYLEEYADRQDAFVFAQAGVPAVMVNSGFADRAALQAFMTGRYHAPDDDAKAGLNLRGAAADSDLHIALGRYFADANRFDEKAAGMESPE